MRMKHIKKAVVAIAIAIVIMEIWDSMPKSKYTYR